MKLIPTISLGKNNKECGTCTKCCEGWTIANIEGRPVTPGNPCYFLEQNVGCKIYDNRPYFPCQKFSCAWLALKDIPDQWKPENCGVIMTNLDVHGEPYVVFINAPLNPSKEMIEWAEEYFAKKKMNFLYVDKRGVHPIGNKNFIRLIREHKHQFKLRKFSKEVVEKYNLDPEEYLDKD